MSLVDAFPACNSTDIPQQRWPLLIIAGAVMQHQCIAFKRRASTSNGMQTLAVGGQGRREVERDWRAMGMAEQLVQVLPVTGPRERKFWAGWGECGVGWGGVGWVG